MIDAGERLIHKTRIKHGADDIFNSRQHTPRRAKVENSHLPAALNER
jgi:hypothetical protein